MNDNTRPGSNTRKGGSYNNNNMRSGNKSQETPKGELFKKVEMMQKKFEKSLETTRNFSSWVKSPPLGNPEFVCHTINLGMWY